MVEVSIIIPVLNQWNYTSQCLAALFRLTPPHDYEIIVIDNGSTDDTKKGLEALCTKHEHLRVITNESNQGYAIANNQGAALAQGRYLILLNNDTIVEPEWLPPLLHAVAQPGVGLVGPRLLFPLSRKVNHAGYSFDRPTLTYTNRWCFAPEDLPEVNKELEVLALLGACLCIRRSLFTEVGGFENYGLEDIDLSLKIRERNLSVRYIPTSTVLHHGSVTLVNTDNNLLVSADTTAFSNRWPPEIVTRMQEVLVTEASATPQEHSLRAAFALEESANLVASALISLEADQKYEAEFKLRCAIELWRANEAAYEELLVLLVQQRRLEEVFALLETYKKISPDLERATQIAQQISKLLPES